EEDVRMRPRGEEAELLHRELGRAVVAALFEATLAAHEQLRDAIRALDALHAREHLLDVVRARVVERVVCNLQFIADLRARVERLADVAVVDLAACAVDFEFRAAAGRVHRAATRGEESEEESDCRAHMASQRSLRPRLTQPKIWPSSRAHGTW